MCEPDRVTHTTRSEKQGEISPRVLWFSQIEYTMKRWWFIYAVAAVATNNMTVPSGWRLEIHGRTSGRSCRDSGHARLKRLGTFPGNGQTTKERKEKRDFMFRFLNQTVDEQENKRKKLLLGCFFDDLLWVRLDGPVWNRRSPRAGCRPCFQ